jgi:predicted Zn-dependent peptidase
MPRMPSLTTLLATLGFVFCGSFAATAHKAPADPKAFVLDVAVVGSANYQISMWVPFGSTSDSVPGIAHVLEHLKFKTDDGHGFVAFDAIPGSSSNASTNYLVTKYDLSVPPQGVAKALKTLAEMINPLTITDSDLKLEKTIVQQELLQRTTSDPDTPFFLDYYSSLYDGLPLAHWPGGTVADVEKVTMQDVLTFDVAHYQKSKVFLLIGGPPLNAENRKALELAFPTAAIGNLLVKQNFSVTRDDKELRKRVAFVAPITLPAIVPAEFERKKISDRVRSIRFTMTKIVSGPTSWRSLAAASILRDAIQSRLPDGLHDHLADDAGLVKDWSVSISRLSEGIWQVGFNANLENGIDPAVVRRTIESYMADLGGRGLSQASFKRLKDRNFLTNEWENADDRVNSIADDAVTFGYDRAISYYDELRRSTLDDVNAVLKTLQGPGRIGIAILQPKGTAE